MESPRFPINSFRKHINVKQKIVNTRSEKKIENKDSDIGNAVKSNQNVEIKE